MKKRQHISIYFLIFVWSGVACCMQYGHNEQAVVVKVPVADCLGKAAEEIDPKMRPEEFYAHLAYSPEKGPDSCPRVHQCLFNEVGVICEEKKDEVLVEFPHLYFLDQKGAKTSRFWLLKSSVHRIKELSEDLRTAIPDPLDYKGRPAYDEKVIHSYFPGVIKLVVFIPQARALCVMLDMIPIAAGE